MTKPIVSELNPGCKSISNPKGAGRKRKCSNPLHGICPQCKQEKDLSEFNLSKTRPNGHTSLCKACLKYHRLIIKHKIKGLCLKCGKPTHRKKYCSIQCYRDRKIMVSADGVVLQLCPGCNEYKPMNSEYYHKNSVSLSGYSTYCKDCAKLKIKKYLDDIDPDIKKQRRRIGYEKNIDKHKQYAKDYLSTKRSRESERRKTDPSFVLKNRMRCLMWNTLKKNKCGRKWQELVGYTVEDLRKHIQKKFQPGMSWDNMGEWHIDHIIPVSVHNFNDPEHRDFKRCWALKNLRPLWAKDNMSKNDKIDKHFQPSLAI